MRVLLQSIPEGPAYALAWNATRPDFFLAVESAFSAAEAAAKAKATRDRAAAQGFDALHREHVAGWARFWARSAVYLPERSVAFLWHYGLYLLFLELHDAAALHGRALLAYGAVRLEPFRLAGLARLDALAL